MKLRNKKTGEIVALDSNHDDSLADFGGKILVETKGKEFSYRTLAELNEEWEDYKPAEPLIKDEKVRKAVRAWADALNFKECKYDAYWKAFRVGDQTISFFGLYGFDLEDDKTYTIAELCGEEEE